MAKRIDSTIAKRIINTHTDLLAKLSKAERLRSNLLEDVIRHSRRMVEKEAMEILNNSGNFSYDDGAKLSKLEETLKLNDIRRKKWF